MRILGIDPGIARTGWGIIDYQNGKAKPIAFDCYETPSTLPTPERLDNIYQSLLQIIEKYYPDYLSIEELFFNTNAKTAFIVGQARGVILLAGAQKKLPISIYTPLQVKIAITGYGRAEKNQVGQMVKILLNLEKIPKPDDTADALAIALAHAFTIKSIMSQQPSKTH